MAKKKIDNKHHAQDELTLSSRKEAIVFICTSVTQELVHGTQQILD